MHAGRVCAKAGCLHARTRAATRPRPLHKPAQRLYQERPAARNQVDPIL